MLFTNVCHLKIKKKVKYCLQQPVCATELLGIKAVLLSLGSFP